MHRVSSNSAASDCVGTCTRHLLENNCGGSSSKVPYLQYWMVLDPPQVPTGQRFLKLWQLLKLWQPHIYTYIYIYIATYSIYIPETKNRQLHFQRPLYLYTVLDVSQIPTRRCCVKHHRRAIYIYCICLIAWWKYFKKTISYIYIYIYWLFEVWCRSEMYWKPKTYADQQRQCSLFVDVDAKVQPTLAKHLKNNYSIYTNIYKHIYIYSLYINIYI